MVPTVTVKNSVADPRKSSSEPAMKAPAPLPKNMKPAKRDTAVARAVLERVVAQVCKVVCIVTQAMPCKAHDTRTVTGVTLKMSRPKPNEALVPPMSRYRAGDAR